MQDIETARQEAKRRVYIQRSLNPRLPVDIPRPNVYILEGCYCLGQGGVEQRFHVHLFSQEFFPEWIRDRPSVIVIEQSEL